jgi:lysophospholipase L1-like esterase
LIKILFLLPLALFFWNWFIKIFIIAKLPKNYPNEVNRKLADGKKQTLVCFGDSNTHGNVSFNWVDHLSIRLQHLNVFNAGVNADLTYTLLNRIDDVIACKPDFITILIGTNDANASLADKNLQSYLSRGKILPEEKVSQKTFIKTYENIIIQLKTRTTAQIALISLPLLSEGLSFRGNTITQTYSEEIVALSKKHRIDFIDFRQSQLGLLPKNNSNKFWSYSKSKQMLLLSIFLRYTFCMSWNSISKLFSNASSPDNIHLNETSGSLLLNLVYEWIIKKKVQELHELV